MLGLCIYILTIFLGGGGGGLGDLKQFIVVEYVMIRGVRQTHTYLEHYEKAQRG